MTTSRLAAVLFLAAFPCLAGPKTNFATHPFFKQFVGSWKGSGELKGTQDGNTLKVEQEWTCKVSDEGELIVDGFRTVTGLAEKQPYKWSFTHNPTTDLYEVVLSNPGQDQNAIRFEGTLTGDPLVLELKAQFGNGGGSMFVTDSFNAAGDVMEGKVVFYNDSGGINLEGVIKNVRVK